MTHQLNNIRGLALRASIAIAAMSTPLSTAHAHDIWIVTEKSGQKTDAQIVFGDLVGPTLADASRIVAFERVSSKGKTDLRPMLSLSTDNGHPILVVDGVEVQPSDVLAVEYDNGFWLKQPGDSHETNTSPLLAPEGTNPHWTVKWGKLLLGPGAYRKKLGDRLELVALEDPFSADSGSTIPVQLLYDGEPFPGAEIAYTDGLEKLPDPDQPVIKTGDDGIARIPIQGIGPVLLTTDVTTPPAHAAFAKGDHLYASLSFDTTK